MQEESLAICWAFYLWGSIPLLIWALILSSCGSPDTIAPYLRSCPMYLHKADTMP